MLLHSKWSSSSSGSSIYCVCLLKIGIWNLSSCTNVCYFTINDKIDIFYFTTSFILAMPKCIIDNRMLLKKCPYSNHSNPILLNGTPCIFWYYMKGTLFYFSINTIHVFEYKCQIKFYLAQLFPNWHFLFCIIKVYLKNKKEEPS